MKKTLFSLAIIALTAIACGHQHQLKDAGEVAKYEAISLQENLPGDSALYGLVCDGCTDSVLVFLPYSGGGLDTFDIIVAHQEHHIYGQLHIGDEVAVIANPEDPDEALTVINTEVLKGTWCYKVTPKLRSTNDLPKRMQRRMMERIPDSVKQMMLTPREYSLRLKRDNTVMVHGGTYRMTTTDDMSPVEYPKVKRYTDWHLFNGRLVLKADTISGFSKEGAKPSIDTVDIEMLTNDTLILRFSDHVQHYYRQVETEGNQLK